MYKCDWRAKIYCDCEFSEIEGYERAMSSNEEFHVIHRLQFYTADGQRRKEHISPETMKLLGLYYKRPAEELLFISDKEYTALFVGCIGTKNEKYFSSETRKKRSQLAKGKNNKERHEEARRKKNGE